MSRFCRALSLAFVCAVASPAAFATQASIVTPTAGPMPMSTFTSNYLNPALLALASCFSGSIAPTDGPAGAVVTYQCWINTSTTPSAYELYDGANWVVTGYLNTSTHVWTPSIPSAFVTSAMLATVNSSSGSAGSGTSVPIVTANAQGQITALSSAAIPTATTSILGLASAGTGLNVSGGALAVAYGSVSGTAAQGNDSRITGALSAATAASTYMPFSGGGFTGGITGTTAEFSGVGTFGTATPASGYTLTVAGSLELQSGGVNITGGNETIATNAGFLQVGTVTNYPTYLMANSSVVATASPSGNFLVGSTTSYNDIFGVPSQLQVYGVLGATFQRYTNDVYGATLSLVKNRGGSAAVQGAAQIGDTLGQIVFGASNGTSEVSGPEIVSVATAVPGTGAALGSLQITMPVSATSNAPIYPFTVLPGGNIGIFNTAPTHNFDLTGTFNLNGAGTVQPGYTIANVYCTGTNDSTAINNAISSQNGAGILDVFTAGPSCGINATVNLKANVHVHSQGGASFGACGTPWNWTGASGGTMVSAAVTSGVMSNPGLSDVCLNGGGLATIGFNKRGVSWGDFHDLVITNLTTTSATYAIQEDVAATPTFADQMTQWRKIQIVVTGSANGWGIGQSSTTYDTASNHYANINIIHQNGIGFVCGNSDGNTFDHFYDITTGTGTSFVAESGTSSVITSCRENHFIGPSVFEGGLTAQAGTYPSFGIKVDFYKLGDGEPQATLNGTQTEIHYDCGGSTFASCGPSNIPTSLAIGSTTGASTATLEVNQLTNFAVAAKFGPSLPVYIEANNPGVGFNSYWNGSNNVFGPGSASNYGGVIVFNASTGGYVWQVSSAAGNAGATESLTNVMQLSQAGVLNTLGYTLNGNALNATGGLVGYGGAFGNATGHASLDVPLAGGVSLTGSLTFPSGDLIINSGSTTAGLATVTSGGIVSSEATVSAAQFPALTGDVTTTAGSLATTVANANGNVVASGTGTSTALPTYTPSVTFTGGTGTSATSTSGKYFRIGKLLWVEFVGTINYTTPPTNIAVTLPLSATCDAAQSQTINGLNASAVILFGYCYLGTSSVQIYTSGFTLPVTATGQTISYSGWLSIQ